jgi:hypothetical protein
MCFERPQGSVVAPQRRRVHRLRMELTRNWPGFFVAGIEMVRRGRLEVRCGRARANTEAHGCRKAGVNCRLAIKRGKYRCTAHEVFEIVAGLAMGRTAMRTIVPRLHLGHRSGSIPVSCWQRLR